MTEHPQKVFVSYTGEDLIDHARAVAEALRRFGHGPVDHRDWVIDGRPSLAVCRERVASCSILVVLVAHRYGWVPSTAEDGDGERSVTWLEVEEARRRNMPVLPFVIADDAEWPVRHIEGLRNAAALQSLDRFKAQLKGTICGFFSAAEKLAHEVVRAVEDAAARLASEQRAAPKPSGVPPRHDDPFVGYRERLASSLRRVKFLGFGEQFQVSLPISELWVPLSAAVPRSFVVDEEQLAHARKDFRAEHVRDTPVEDSFRKAQQYDLRAVVLLGDPGSGKTTAARRLAWQCADLVQGPESLGLPADVVPVLLRLRDLPKDEIAAGLEPMLRRQLAATDVSTDPDLGDRLLQRGGILWILDGLDEVASLEARAALSRWIRAASQRRTRDWFLVTSRYAGYEKAASLGDDFLVMHVNPLTDDPRREFVTRWYRTVERQIRGDDVEAQTQATKRSTHLLQIVEGPDFSSIRLASMAANPLLLSILCIVHRRDMDLPRRRAELYAKAIDVLLDSWRHEWRKLQGRDALGTGVAKLVLQPLAWYLHQQESRVEAECGELAAVAGTALDRLGAGSDRERDPRAFLDTIHTDAGLLVCPKPGHFAFLHLTFQEYLAARHCIDTGKAKELAEHFGIPWWNEPILLALSMAPDERFAAELFETVLSRTSAFTEKDLSLLRLCVRDTLILPPAPFLRCLDAASTSGELRRALVQVCKDRGSPELVRKAGEIDARLRAADAQSARHTARLADTHIETVIDERTGIQLVRIPGGELFIDESTQPVVLRAFWLAAHPVTNAQYERFLRETKHSKPDFWSNSKFNAAQQPVVGVSWEDAKAFCKWAGLELPSETQWEYACRAGTRTEYWSGDSEADLARVGWYDGNSGGVLHAVGEKPANPFGLFDMHGNVWEWCEDTWSEDYGNAPRDGTPWVKAGTAFRVFRGGCFGSSARDCRPAFRGGAWPVSRDGHLGFRPARSSPGDLTTSRPAGRASKRGK